MEKNLPEGHIASIFGVRFHDLTPDALFDVITRGIKNNQHLIISHVNVQALNIAYENPWYRDFLNASYRTFCDGAGVILGAKLLGFAPQKRMTAADWIWKLAEYFENTDVSIYFLGGRPGVAQKAANKIQARYPGLNIVGTHHGYFDKSTQGLDTTRVISEINGLCPNILIVGFGMPLQEQWLAENWANIDANIALPLGALFDYISGELKRAPNWMNDYGLEWLGRLIIEPRRLWKRYIIGNPLFIWRVLLERFGYKKYL